MLLKFSKNLKFIMVSYFIFVALNFFKKRNKQKKESKSNCRLKFSNQDKILQSGGMTESIQVTNDGATILKALGVDNPAAKVLVGLSFCFNTSQRFFVKLL